MASCSGSPTRFGAGTAGATEAGAEVAAGCGPVSDTPVGDRANPTSSTTQTRTASSPAPTASRMISVLRLVPAGAGTGVTVGRVERSSAAYSCGVPRSSIRGTPPCPGSVRYAARPWVASTAGRGAGRTGPPRRGRRSSRRGSRRCGSSLQQRIHRRMEDRPGGATVLQGRCPPAGSACSTCGPDRGPTTPGTPRPRQAPVIRRSRASMLSLTAEQLTGERGGVRSRC